MKMGLSPEGKTELLHYVGDDGKRSPFPLVKVENIFVLPGVPQLVRRKWQPLAVYLTERYGASQAGYSNRCASWPGP